MLVVNCIVDGFTVKCKNIIMRQYEFLINDNLIQYSTDEEYLTLVEVAEITGRKSKTIKNWHWDKDLPAKIENNKWFISPEDLEVFLLDHKQPRKKKRKMMR
jgi:hypothetical protein